MPMYFYKLFYFMYKNLAFTNGNLLVLTMRQESLYVLLGSDIKIWVSKWFWVLGFCHLVVTDIVGLKMSV